MVLESHMVANTTAISIFHDHAYKRGSKGGFKHASRAAGSILHD
jgi:hypothetical protein